MSGAQCVNESTCIDPPGICTDRLCVPDGSGGSQCLTIQLNCDDGNPCTTDHPCDPQLGCTHTWLCPQPSDACTQRGCEDGECIEEPRDCDDENSCTDDSCVIAQGGCVHKPKCDDNSPCTTDPCVDGVCQPHLPVCNDNNPCTNDLCSVQNNAAVCTYVPLTCTPCPNGRCQGGTCVSTGCNVSLTSGSGSPCGQVTLTLGRQCWPNCGTMSIQIEPVYPPGVPPFLSISTAFSLYCGGPNNPQPIIVTIAEDAPASTVTLLVTGTTSMGSTCQTVANITVTDCPGGQLCCASGNCCPQECEECLDSGTLSGGIIDVSPEVPCMGDTLVFAVSGVVDSGGIKRTECYAKTAIPPVPPNTVYSTTWYIYNCAGNVERVVPQNAGSSQYSATRFSYAKNQRSVSFALAETWDPDGNSDGQVDNYAVQWLREFRYDSGRARYLNRKLDPVTLAPIAADTVWTDYDGDDPYGDFAIVNSGSWFASPTRSYEPGIAMVDPWTSSGPANTKYYHSDHLGTTRTMSNSTSFDGGTRVLTAFGEKIAGPTPPDRYGYVGAHGYQTHEDLPFQHVGARYYDPGSGRFLQRDEIGLRGGLNVYAYVGNQPVTISDPSGFGYDRAKRDGEGSYKISCSIGWSYGMKICGELPNCPSTEELDRRAKEHKRRKEERRKEREKLENDRKNRPPPPPFYFPGSCFVAGTPVFAFDGDVPIESLLCGTLVQSADHAMGTNELSQVVAAFVGTSTEIIQLSLSGEVISTTRDHPFWVVGTGWITAGALKQGDKLGSIDGTHVLIRNVVRTTLSEPVEVFNVTVEGAHTYYVGYSRVLVHNKPG